MAQKILAQEWERLKTRTDLEVCINPVSNPLCMSLYMCFIVKVDRRRCLLQLTSYAAALQDSNVGKLV